MRNLFYFLAFIAILFYLLYVVVSYGLSEAYKNADIEQQRYENYIKSLDR